MEIYNRYFAKNKPLRHYSQHIFIAALGYLVLYLIFDVEVRPFFIFLYFISTFIVDLDGLFARFIFQNQIPEAKDFVMLIKQRRYYEAAAHAETNHKKINKLLLHNVITYLIILVLFIISINYQSQVWIVALGAILIHFSFDIFDDFYQLGHMNNWLWPIRFKSPF